MTASGAQPSRFEGGVFDLPFFLPWFCGVAQVRDAWVLGGVPAITEVLNQGAQCHSNLLRQGPVRIASTKPARIEFFAFAAFRWNGTSPSTRTCRRGKAPSPWDVSLPAAAGRRDNFCATSWISLSQQTGCTLAGTSS